MQWKLTFSPGITQEEQREILKKHYIKKEPFSKVSIHEMHITEFVEHMLDSGLEIKLNTRTKEVICSHIDTE